MKPREMSEHTAPSAEIPEVSKNVYEMHDKLADRVHEAFGDEYRVKRSVFGRDVAALWSECVSEKGWNATQSGYRSNKRGLEQLQKTISSVSSREELGDALLRLWRNESVLNPIRLHVLEDGSRSMMNDQTFAYLENRKKGVNTPPQPEWLEDVTAKLWRAKERGEVEVQKTIVREHFERELQDIVREDNGTVMKAHLRLDQSAVFHAGMKIVDLMKSNPEFHAAIGAFKVGFVSPDYEMGEIPDVVIYPKYEHGETIEDCLKRLALISAELVRAFPDDGDGALPLAETQLPRFSFPLNRIVSVTQAGGDTKVPIEKETELYGSNFLDRMFPVSMNNAFFAEDVETAKHLLGPLQTPEAEQHIDTAKRTSTKQNPHA